MHFNYLKLVIIVFFDFNRPCILTWYSDACGNESLVLLVILVYLFSLYKLEARKCGFLLYKFPQTVNMKSFWASDKHKPKKKQEIKKQNICMKREKKVLCRK